MSNRSNRPRTTSLTTLILAAVILVIATIFGAITGVDPLVILGINTAQPTVIATTAAPPTAIPTTAVPTTAVPPTQSTRVAGVSGSVNLVTLQQGSGAIKGFWQVYFNAPTGSSDRSTYVGGIDGALANAIANTQRTLDIAAFEFNNEVLTAAIVDAKKRGVQVRIVTDNEHGIGDTTDKSWEEFKKAGIPVVDDGRGDLMHNKFMILDGITVWTGSWNYTVNGTYRNNNNALALRSRPAVEAYQAEFNEMFERKQFGPTSETGNNARYSQDGVPIQILFAPEDETVEALQTLLGGAQKSIRFMAFVFSLDELRDLIIDRAKAGVEVAGIFERRSSTASWSELPPLFCAGLAMRQDGNRYVLHHKVFIIDDETVVTGSFNFSASAAEGNDENLVIITDPDLAAQYIAEFDRRWAEAVVPTDITCN